jgi:hypothetical protein
LVEGYISGKDKAWLDREGFSAADLELYSSAFLNSK